MFISSDFTITCTILLGSLQVLARSTSVGIAKQWRVSEESRDAPFREEDTLKNDESEQRAMDSDDIDGWRESPYEELMSATGSNYPSYFGNIENRVNNEMKSNDDARRIGDDAPGEAVPGIPGMDYPNHRTIPATSFTCANKEPGGYYADVETGCQVFHVCNIGNVKSSFLCPTGSIFNQKYSVCDWWYGFNCEEALEFYEKKSSRDESQMERNDNYRMFNGRKNLEEYSSGDSIVGNDNPLASGAVESSDYPRRPSAESGFPNEDQSYSNDVTRTRENQDHGDNRYNAPRGFSRNRNDSLRGNTVAARVSTNDLASYVNHAYLNAESYSGNDY